MGVITSADTHRDEAKEKIKEAKALLVEAIDEETWGSEDWNDDYMELLEETIIKLGRMGRKL